jgi:hypothetical protein
MKSSNVEEVIEKKLNVKKIGWMVLGVAIIAAGVWSIGFTTKGRTIVRVIWDEQPAVTAYQAQDANGDAWKAEFAKQVETAKDQGKD